jgi:hypothetical protein
MSENEGIRIVSLFVGILLCTTLTQTACAAWNTPNWNANVGNTTVWNTPNWNTNAGNTTVWNTINENKTEDATTWNSTDGSLPPSDLMNTPIPSSSFVNVPKFSDLLKGSISQNGIQLPRIQKS